jgi:DNA-binding response OmpR family regulator
MDRTKRTVLVVEDDVLLMEAISKKLILNGFNVISFSNGTETVDYINSGKDLPDAIWLDFLLKDMNGLDIMHIIKGNPTWSSIPVIVVSNSGSADKVKTMLALGAKQYLVKADYRLEDIITIITDFIETEHM